MSEPEKVIAWRKKREAAYEAPPAFCYTCDDYDHTTGYCRHFQETPPDDFKNTENACPEWCEELPF